MHIKASHFSSSVTPDGSTHLLNFEIVWTWAEMMSEADDAFLCVRLDHMQPKSWLQDYAITSGAAIWLQNLNCCKNLS